MGAESEKMIAFAPATGEIIQTFTEVRPQSAPELMAIAKRAFKDWSGFSVAERVHYIKKVRSVIVERMDEIANLISKDTGKVKTDAIVSDIMPTLDAILHIEKDAVRVLKGKKTKTPLLLMGSKSRIEYMPMGTVLVISPWNYPFLLAFVPVLSALAAGNTVILKPSEVTPAVGGLIMDILQEVGFPEGTVQVAIGGKELGAALTKQKPDYIFFTGSVRTGKIIQEIAAQDLIPTTLELGGNDPMIVLKDADIKRAAKAAVWGAFTNSGQVCMSVERLIVEEEIREEFLAELLKNMESLRQGTDEHAEIGSMTYPEQVSIVKAHVEDALEKGAKLAFGVSPTQWVHDSMFIKPIILTDVTEDMLIMQEETFGPVLPIITVKSKEEAVRIANGTVYGLNASVWSRDTHKARSIASQLVSGAVLINEILITVANNYLPFGGTKNSGIGRYHGERGLTMFTHEKAIMESVGIKSTEIHWYPYKNKYKDFLSLFQAYFGNSRRWLMVLIAYIRLFKLSK